MTQKIMGVIFLCLTIRPILQTVMRLFLTIK